MYESYMGVFTWNKSLLTTTTNDNSDKISKWTITFFE